MKYNIAVDTHCHTIASKHAICTALETIELAKMAGLSGVSITDHHWSIAHDCEQYRVNAADRAYFHVFSDRFRHTDDSISLFKGIELNILDHEPFVTPVTELIDNGLDFKIAGVHHFPHLYKSTPDRTLNTDMLLSAMKDDPVSRFNILAHPIQESTPIHADKIAQVCSQRNIALELNNSTLCNNRSDRSEIITLLESAVRHETRVTVSSDAHVPTEIGHFENAIALLSEIGFPEELLINTSVENFRQFLSS